VRGEEGRGQDQRRGEGNGGEGKLAGVRKVWNGYVMLSHGLRCFQVTSTALVFVGNVHLMCQYYMLLIILILYLLL